MGEIADATKISCEEFIAALKRQGPISALLDKARRVDVIGLSKDESKDLARGIKDFAGTKNGPMLIMGLPGPLQALLAFNGTTMPGLDRLGYLKASPRQVLDRLLCIEDEKLLSQYQFDKVSKADWIYYLEHCKDALIPPFVRFLKRSESAGGFSDKEIGALVLANRNLINLIPLERIDPDSATELIVSGTAQPLWQKYDFNRFGKEHWRAVLKELNVTDIPKPCERFLSNEDGKGFSNAELIELAHHCDLVEQWIDPDETAFADVYDLYVQGKGKLLWRRFPFSMLNRSEWEVVLNDPKIDIPAAFVEAVKSGMFSQDELCEFAVRNPKVFPFVGIKSLSSRKLVELLLRCDSAYLWQNYPFERLSASDWVALICNYKGQGIVCHAELIVDSDGMSEAFAEQIVRKNDVYLKYIPLKYIGVEFAIELLRCGRHDDLWSRYDFSRFDKSHWQALFSKTSRIPAAFNEAVKRGLFTLGELCDYARQNESMVAYLPVALLDRETLTDLLVHSNTDILWTVGNLRKLSAECWVKLIQSHKPQLFRKQENLNVLRKVRGLTVEIARKILAIDCWYYEYLPPELLPRGWVVEHLISGDPKGLWESYPFSLLDDDDWFLLLANITKAVPDEGKAFLANASGNVDVVRLNALLAKRRDLVWYLNPKDIDPGLAAELLTEASGCALWNTYDFSRFSDGQLRKISNKFSSARDAFSDNEIFSLAERNVVNVLELLSIERILQSGVPFFAKICGFAKVSKSAMSLIERKLTTGTKPWLELPREYQFALLVSMPLCRKFIDWQSFELGMLDKLLMADEMYRRELCFARKFKWFIWRHWLFLLVIAIIVTGLFCRVERERQRSIAAWEASFVRKIDAWAERGDYEALDGYLRMVSHGPEAYLLRDRRTANARSRLATWKQDRAFVAAQFEMLRRIAGDGWPVGMLDSAEGCFKSLQQNRAVRHDEKNDINGLRRAYDSRRAEIARIKKNVDFATQIADIEKYCSDVATVEAAQLFISDLELISSDSDIDEENRLRCSNAYAAMCAHVDALVRQKLSDVQKKIDSAGSISEIDQIGASVKELSSCAHVSVSAKTECMALVDRISARRVALQEATDKAQVEAIHQEVIRLMDDIGSTDEAGFVAISTAYSQLKYKACFDRYSVEHPDEYAALCAAIVKRNDGVARADAVIEAATNSIEGVDDRIVSDADVGAVARQLRALDAWKAEFASLVAWRLEDVESCRKRIADAYDGMKDRISRQEAAEKAQVESIHQEVLRLMDDIGSTDGVGFETISAAYLQLKDKACFSRYSEEHTDEYVALGAAIEKRNDGIARAYAAIAAATGSIERVDDRIVSDADVEEVTRQLRALDAWKDEYDSLVEWMLEDVERCRKRVADVREGMKERISLVSALNKAIDYGTLYDSIQMLLKRYSTCAECRQIDASRIMSESQVKLAITKSGWFFREALCEFVGVIEVGSKNETDVVPILTKKVDAKAEIFCVVMHYDGDTRKWTPIVKKIFERTKTGGFRKVPEMSYRKCQGIGLFVCKDLAYVSAECTEKKFLDGSCSTEKNDGCFWMRIPCKVCHGTGRDAASKRVVWTNCPKCKGSGRMQEKYKCERCKHCNYKGYKWIPYRCPTCKGFGKRYPVATDICSTCNGSGCTWVRSGERSSGAALDI